MMSSSTAHEPRIARVAAVMADAARSRMLAYLLSGEYASAGELARVASVTPATASGHLAKLIDNGLLSCEARGRHRYYRLASAEVAHALEALALVAERGAHEHEWERPERKRLRYARCCYGHLAGVLGVMFYERLHALEGLRPVARGFELTTAGEAWLANMGMAPSKRVGRDALPMPVSTGQSVAITSPANWPTRFSVIAWRRTGCAGKLIGPWNSRLQAHGICCRCCRLEPTTRFLL